MLTKQSWEKFEQALSSNQQDWKTREKTFQSLLKGLKEDHSLTFEFMQQNSKLLAIQLNDLRSGIVKLASSCLIVFSSKQPLFHKTVNYEKFSDSILRREEFIKAIGSANKVIATHAAQALLSFFSNDFVNFSTLEHFISRHYSHKIAKVRERCAEVLSIFMQRIIQQQSTQKIKEDQISFFKKYGDKFCDDASGPVRKFGKRIKVEMVDFQNSISQNGHDQQYSMSQPLNDDQQSKSKSYNRKINTTKIKKQLTIPQPPKINQMEIEEDTSLMNESIQEKKSINRSFQKSNTYVPQNNSKQKKNKKTTVKEVLNDEEMSLLEKVNFLRNYDLDSYCRNINFNEFRSLLDIYEIQTDPELLSWIEKIISMAKISQFFLQLLMFLETNGRNYTKLPEILWSIIFSQGLLLFIQYFQAQNNIESLQLLNKRFDVEELEVLARSNNRLIQELIFIIQKNVENIKNSQTFLRLNFEFMELLFQSHEIIEEFLLKLEQFKPNLRKFINIQSQDQSKLKQNSIKRKKLLQKSNQNLQKSSKKQKNDMNTSKQQNNSIQQSQASGMEIEEEQTIQQKPIVSEEEENAQLVKMLEEANLQTRKSVLQQIYSHLNQLQNEPDLDQDEKQKLFRKTIAILNCLSQTEQIDKQLLEQCFEVMEILQNYIANPIQDQQTLMNIILLFFDNKFYSRDLSSERLLQISLRKKFLTFSISELTVSQDFEKLVKILKSLISMLKVGKFSDFQDRFLKEFLQVQGPVISVMQKLFVHQQVSVRKNVVHFFVQAYHFIPSEEFEELLYPFTQEQKKLVEIYIKKSKSQQLILILFKIFQLYPNLKVILLQIQVKKTKKQMQELLCQNLSFDEVLMNIRQFPYPKGYEQNKNKIKKKTKKFDKSFLIPSKFKRNRISSLEVMSFMFFQSNKEWFINSIRESQAQKKQRLIQKNITTENLKQPKSFQNFQTKQF